MKRLSAREQWIRSKPESEFQAEVLDLAGRLGYLRFHDFDARRDNEQAGVDPGFLDTWLCHPDRDVLYAWELKRQTGTPRPGQRLWMEVLGRCTRLECGLYRPGDWDRIIEILQGDERS